MAVNQSQVDNILSSASADDPEVKMQNLQDEVDLLKKSVKKLLIDLRERMNEIENPFILGSQTPQAPPVDIPLPEETVETEETPVSEPVPPEITQEIPQAMTSNVPLQPQAQPLQGMSATEQLAADENLLRSLQEKLGTLSGQQKKAEESSDHQKLRLHKLHRMFEWTDKMVKKYGHDRLEIMVDTYKTMGYLSIETCRQVKDIARLMPDSLGESHDVSSDEFVSELYVLNRILTPADSSLDRDMIEVLMERKAPVAKDFAKKTTPKKEEREPWTEMLDRI
ncbi:MAG: hypothetical protein U9N40_01670 [Euryarchaeota archaeon]|nr:hypothetical protein [Euryarchaeota archaeon]